VSVVTPVDAVVSTATLVESVVVDSESPPQAANTLTANTNNSFFIVVCFLFVILGLIPLVKKGNPSIKKYFQKKAPHIEGLKNHNRLRQA
jgi:hypothetical protein